VGKFLHRLTKNQQEAEKAAVAVEEKVHIADLNVTHKKTDRRSGKWATIFI
jgi:hypothetical protein